jgi:hypothetical protein
MIFARIKIVPGDVEVNMFCCRHFWSCNLEIGNAVFRMIKSRRIRWTKHEARMEKKRNICMLWLKRQKERDLILSSLRLRLLYQLDKI